MNWYVIYTKPRHERRAEAEFSARKIETYLPVVPVPRRRGRPPVKPYFSRYLFIRVDLDQVGLSRLNWTPGVQHVVMFGGIPARLHESVIARIREHLAQPHVMDERGEMLEPGNRVRITSGPFQDIEGVFDKRLSAMGRARVLVQLLQRWTALNIEATALRKA